MVEKRHKWVELSGPSHELLATKGQRKSEPESIKGRELTGHTDVGPVIKNA